MYTELVDALRCPAGHEESWLVAAADRSEGRHIVSGVLGCPVCRTRYAIQGGLADFSAAAPLAAGDEPPRAAHDMAAVAGLALKLAALLDLTDAGGYVVLLGGWSRIAHALRAIVPVPVLVVNAPEDLIVGDGVSGVRSGIVPVLPGSARGVVLDTVSGEEPWRDAGLLASALRALKPGGRVVAVRSLTPPPEVALLAEDDAHWVGTIEVARPLLQIQRAPR